MREDEAKTRLISHRDRSPHGATRGFRHFSEIKYDDLTFRALQHFRAVGEERFFEENVLALGDNILQSPIERAIFAFLLLGFRATGIRPNEIHTVLPGDELPVSLLNSRGLAICPQHQVECYFLDFAVFFNSGDIKLAFDLECDGAEFHGKCNRQASHDFMRDKVVSAHGFQIYRIPGARIVQNPLFEAEKFVEETVMQVDRLRAAA